MPARCVRPSQHGFTLMELLISLAVLAVLLAVAMPYVLGELPRYRLNGAARQVLGELMGARMKAINENGTVKVFFLDTHRYTICAVPNGASALAACLGTVTNKDLQTTYGNVTLTANRDPVFLSKGTADNIKPLDKIVITLTNPSGSKTITISYAGRAKIT